MPQDEKIYRKQAYAVIAKILEKLVIEGNLDEEIPLDYEERHAKYIERQIHLLIDEFVKLSK